MTVLILEDEAITAEELRHYVCDIDPTIEVVALLETIDDAVHFLTTKPGPDLIFSDIQLADGLSFDVFDQVPVRCPVIFCTAFDEYAMQAFAANGIDYVLKPFDRKAIANSLTKFKTLQTYFQRDTPIPQPVLNEPLQRLIDQLRPTRRSSFLVNYKGKYYPIPVSEIAFFYTENEIVWLFKSSGEKYALDHTLDELETMLDPTQFYRANRQFVLRYEAILEFEPYFNRKLAVRLNLPTPEPIIVSKAKAGDFMRWLEQR
ncbi:LytR/AlgR family response regulator transcription factor [Spirosoma utsteinense]|uniref:DNA-binding LytR/AlgR family response regulator n=1 Tax=Spirosoma utsteinense TaxID=2585773 RepID=A0ABR6VZH0_9BACT|nr:LytTR family DNA-binding domain-containing protein [Spirosoma utsteinense]MBC3784593.1 DNA-binding LytR/AlgR family response regulator [Spirosoma utsteinense]MBC3789654.1 DNA-binding LytR/AlgR family response regulator [Spirosoma utsteinense]